MRISDWSSDGCSSDLKTRLPRAKSYARRARRNFASSFLAPSSNRKSGHPPIRTPRPRGALLGNEDRVLHLDARLASAGRASFFTSMKFARFRRVPFGPIVDFVDRSEGHTSELQSLMRISYAVFCLKKKTTTTHNKLKLSNITQH